MGGDAPEAQDVDVFTASVQTTQRGVNLELWLDHPSAELWCRLPAVMMAFNMRASFLCSCVYVLVSSPLTSSSHKPRVFFIMLIKTGRKSKSKLSF